MNRSAKETDALVDAWSLRFARAYAEFVRVLSDDSRSVPQLPTALAFNSSPRPFIVQDVSRAEDPDGYNRMEEGHKQFLAAVKKGTAEMVDFDPAVPAKAAGSRLKQIFKQRRIKQSDVARHLGIAPSVINKVLKHPERSRLDTIRKIANAAGIGLSEIF